jgi:hypothetical protein
LRARLWLDGSTQAHPPETLPAGSEKRLRWPRPRTLDEFAARRARQPERSEFIGSQPRLMAPASIKHTIIKNNVGRCVRQ